MLQKTQILMFQILMLWPNVPSQQEWERERKCTGNTDRKNYHHALEKMYCCMHARSCVFALLERTWQHTMLSPHSSPPIIKLDLGTVQCVSDSIPMALFPHGPDWARLTHRDRLSHVAEDAPLACCLSLHLTAASWMQLDIRLWKRCECPYPQYDTGCQGSRSLQLLWFLRPVYSTR